MPYTNLMGFFVCKKTLELFQSKKDVFETCRRQSQTSVTWWWMLELQVGGGGQRHRMAPMNDVGEAIKKSCCCWGITQLANPTLTPKTSRTFWLPCLHMYASSAFPRMGFTLLPSSFGMERWRCWDKHETWTTDLYNDPPFLAGNSSLAYHAYGLRCVFFGGSES